MAHINHIAGVTPHLGEIREECSHGVRRAVDPNLVNLWLANIRPIKLNRDCFLMLGFRSKAFQ